MANCYGKTLNQCMNEFAVSTETHFCHICKMDKEMKITREILQAPKLFSFVIIREFNYIKNMQKFDVNTSVDLNEHRFELKCALVHDGPMERVTILPCVDMGIVFTKWMMQMCKLFLTNYYLSLWDVRIT